MSNPKAFKKIYNFLTSKEKQEGCEILLNGSAKQYRQWLKDIESKYSYCRKIGHDSKMEVEDDLL